MTDRQQQEPAHTEPQGLFPDHAHNPDRTGAGIYKPTPAGPVSVGSEHAGHGDGSGAPNGGASSGVRTPCPDPAPQGAALSAREAEEVSGPGVPESDSFLERARRRKREPEQRQHRTHPRFSEAEWTAITTAAQANQCKPGTFTALATILAAGHDDPRAAVADFRASVQSLNSATTALDRIGTLLNQETAYLHQGGTIYADHQRLLERIAQAVDAVEDAAVHLVRD